MPLSIPISKMKRIEQLKSAIQHYPPAICTERAVFYTQYFKNKSNRKKPTAIQMAEVLSDTLTRKQTQIYPDELLVGAITSKRVGGPIYPELHGVPVMEDLFRFTSRKVNPFQITKKERNVLLTYVLPYWVNKFLAVRSFSFLKSLQVTMDQLNARYYLINESGGIAHFVPNYELIIIMGLDGIRQQIKVLRVAHQNEKNSEAVTFYSALLTMIEGVIQMAENYSKAAKDLAREETDPVRKAELERIAEICSRVPRKPARSFYEALQSLWFVHTGILLESLDNGISFGRMDQYLYPFYADDIKHNRITPAFAKELLACFTIKCSEVIPVLTTRISKYHGGLMSGQAVSVGGKVLDGKDGCNDLTMMFLEIMDELRLRQPNYHARVHTQSPPHYIDKIGSVLSKGATSPALYNDEVIIPTLVAHGYKEDDAIGYATVGCVEPTVPGKSFASTDAALFNIPICLELALNQGKRFGHAKRVGSPTPDPKTFRNIQDVQEAFGLQLEFMIDRLSQDLSAIELGNSKYHPTPLSSLSISGCIVSAKDATAGGAQYNFSGIQGVGISTVGDSLFALDKIVFQSQKYTLTKVVQALKKNYLGYEKLRHWFLNAEKFGNDDAKVDQFTEWVMHRFCKALSGKMNTRGGPYIAGFYSMTSHDRFGQITGALPNGRSKGDGFPSGIAPMNGYDRKGPTALFNSITRLKVQEACNGVNLNVKFDRCLVKGSQGSQRLTQLLQTYFKKGGMQVQLNVFDPAVLKQAKLFPEKYPGLLVRVSGYSAYFNDLSPEMKDEIIARMAH